MPFLDNSGKNLQMNKIFVYEKYICLPNFMSIELKIRKLGQTEYLITFFLVYLAFGNIRYNFNLFYYIDNIYIIKLHMYTKLFVIWVKNNIVMALFPVPVEYLWEKSLTGRGGYLFSRYDRNFF